IIPSCIAHSFREPIARPLRFLAIMADVTPSRAPKIEEPATSTVAPARTTIGAVIASIHAREMSRSQPRQTLRGNGRDPRSSGGSRATAASPAEANRRSRSCQASHPGLRSCPSLLKDVHELAVSTRDLGDRAFPRALGGPPSDQRLPEVRPADGKANE